MTLWVKVRLVRLVRFCKFFAVSPASLSFYNKPCFSNSPASWLFSTSTNLTDYNCVFTGGDMTADISDTRSLFGQHLIQFCHNNNLVLFTKEKLPPDSHTYISEAWHTTSWLDHYICSADAHHFLYPQATTDHIRVYMDLNCENVPELVSYENSMRKRKLC